MAVSVSYPGVYIQEVPSGARAIAGVGTSIALFVGMAPQGRMNTPVFVSSFAAFEREFGSRGGTSELADQVYMFFLNGGSQAYVMRIANGEAEADVTLRNEAGTATLQLTARDPGALGNLIRAEVDYNTASPERSFNLTVYRRVLQADGTFTREDEETFLGLSMNSASPDFVTTRVDGSSALVTAASLGGVPASTVGKSISGIVFATTSVANDTAINNEITALVAAGTAQLRVSVDNLPAQQITVSPQADLTATLDRIASDIVAAYSGAVTLTAGLGSGAATGVAGGRLIWFESPNGPVAVQAAGGGDISVPLQFGVHAGGIEADGYSAMRPVPTGGSARLGDVVAAAGNTLSRLRDFAEANRANAQTITIDDGTGAGAAVIATGVDNVATRLYEATTTPLATGTNGSMANVRTALDQMVAAINAQQSDWTAARHGLRLSMKTARNGVAGDLALVMTTAGTNILSAAGFPMEAPASANVSAYSLGVLGGAGGTGAYQNQAGELSTEGLDGSAPGTSDYDEAFAIAEKEIDLFNMLVLPFAQGQTDRAPFWASGSAFCAKERAFLFVDPPSSWTTVDAAVAGIDGLRIGVETRNSACFWPRLRIADATNPNGRTIDPSGAIAGLAARTDGRFGVWKAPAGVEATMRGVIGLSAPMSDIDNGRINPKALNALRVFPSGVVSWGARTLVGFNSSGNIDDKYIPVRRTTLFIEESLYRGLRFAVFQPNAEDLWAQIRLAAGSFMSGLFRQGAFAGTKASDAFFVICNSTTTTQTDINLGIVNVVVGFAPLKPAEFVVVTIQQIAGQAA